MSDTDADRRAFRDRVLAACERPGRTPMERAFVDAALDVDSNDVQRLADGTLSAASAAQAVTDAMEMLADEAWLAAKDPAQYRRRMLRHLEQASNRFRSLIDTKE